MLIGTDNTSISRADFEKGDIPNANLAEECMSYARVAQVAINAIRVVLFGASFWYKRLTRTFLPFETLSQVVNIFSPTHERFSAKLSSSALLNTLIFISSYFRFWPSLIYSSLALLMTPLQRLIFFEDDKLDLVIHTACFLLWQSACMIACHFLTNKLGSTIVEAVVSHNLKAKLLDNIDSGLILLD